MEGINGPIAFFGTLNQTFPQGGPVPAGFLTTQNGFNAGIGTMFNPATTNNDYIPANTRSPYVQNWVLSIQREIAKDTVLEVAYTGNHARGCPLWATTIRPRPIRLLLRVMPP